MPAIQEEPEKETVMDNIIDLDETEEEPKNSDADQTIVDSAADSSSE